MRNRSMQWVLAATLAMFFALGLLQEIALDSLPDAASLGADGSQHPPGMGEKSWLSILQG